MKKHSVLNTIIITLIVFFLPFIVLAPIPHNNSFSFYGKVVDQNSQPIAGAEVKIGVTSDLPENNYEEVDKEYILETDQNGKFILAGAFGFGMQISDITKPGYELSIKAQRSYTLRVSSEITHPDANNPVIYKMWKQAGKEQLIESSWHGKVACDGTTNHFDLATGLKSNDGNLEVVCTRDPLRLPPASTGPFMWKFQIRIIGGGIQATSDEFTYLAPEVGYKAALIFGQTADDPSWNSKKPLPRPKEYYIKTANGNYGRLFVDWYAWQDSPMHFEWNCSINPSGSRNLER